MSVRDATRLDRTRPWQGEPPAPSSASPLYGGLVLRRSLAYLVDVLIIAVLGLGLGFLLSLIGFLSFGLLSPLAFVVLALWPLAFHSFFIATRSAARRVGKELVCTCRSLWS